MDKHEVLECLARSEQADAIQIASAFRASYAAVAMSLLRLVRQGLVKRHKSSYLNKVSGKPGAAHYIDPESGIYWYCLSARGRARLEFFHS